jgi:opacity protein-like surface antigen
MRRLKISFLIPVLLISVSSMAQKGTGFIGVSGGISLPMGNWGKSNYIVSTTGFANDPSGFANKGGFGSIDGAWFFSRHFAVGALFNYGTYKTKNLDVLSSGYRESFDVDQVTTTANSYKMWSLMPGLYFNYPIVKKLSVTARALAGITHATTPTIAVAVEDGGIDDGTFEQKSASKTAFGFDGGVGLSYAVAKCLAINLRGDYFYSKPDFTIENTQRQNSAGRLVTNYNQALAGINGSLGVALRFH